MGKSTINIYKWPCSIAMLNYQRVSPFRACSIQLLIYGSARRFFRWILFLLETGRADSPNDSRGFPNDGWSWDSPSFLLLKISKFCSFKTTGLIEFFNSNWSTGYLGASDESVQFPWKTSDTTAQRLFGSGLDPVRTKTCLLKNGTPMEIVPIFLGDGSISHVISNHLTGALRGSFLKIPCIKRTSKPCND